jgi:hypothetical protein
MPSLSDDPSSCCSSVSALHSSLLLHKLHLLTRRSPLPHGEGHRSVPCFSEALVLLGVVSRLPNVVVVMEG